MQIGTKYYRLLLIIGHLRKYWWEYQIKDKHVTTIRNKLSHTLMQGISKSIQSNNDLELKNRVMDNY